MPNILKACWESNEMRLSLISIKRKGIPLEEGYLIDEVASETLGKQTLINEFANENEIHGQLERALNYCGADRKLTRLVNRLRNNAIEFPIDEVRVNEAILECQWITNQLKDILQMEINSIETIYDGGGNSYVEELKEAYELILFYNGKEIVLLNEDQMSQKILEADVEFELSFSLDTAMKFVIYEKWREYGIAKVKEVRKATFYHPIFYTGDKISIQAKQIDGKWEFNLTHIETKEEMSF